MDPSLDREQRADGRERKLPPRDRRQDQLDPGGDEEPRRGEGDAADDAGGPRREQPAAHDRGEHDEREGRQRRGGERDRGADPPEREVPEAHHVEAGRAGREPADRERLEDLRLRHVPGDDELLAQERQARLAADGERRRLQHGQEQVEGVHQAVPGSGAARLGSPRRNARPTATPTPMRTMGVRPLKNAAAMTTTQYARSIHPRQPRRSEPFAKAYARPTVIPAVIAPDGSRKVASVTAIPGTPATRIPSMAARAIWLIPRLSFERAQSSRNSRWVSQPRRSMSSRRMR